MAGEGADELVGAESLEVATGREVADLPVALRKGVVGDLADEQLDEGVLAPLGAARVALDGQELARDEAPQARLEIRLVDPLAPSAAVVKLWPRTAASEEGPVGWLEGIQPGGDELRERLGNSW